MEYGFLSRAGKFLQEQKKNRRWMMIFLCLAGGVTLGTLGFLKLYGQAMTHKVKVLDCQYEVHVHTEDCYEEDEDGSAVLVCEHADEAEYVIHTHNDDCYNAKGELVCLLEEHELHEHDEDCWEEQEVLICGKEEAELTAAENAEEHAEQAEEASEEAEQAEDDSQDAESVQELACEKEEHKHDDSCYADGAGCELEEHKHGDGCYEVTEELTCETETHTHDDGCYGEGETVLDCGEEEHEHGGDCYDEDDELVCEKDEHEHDDSCYTTTEGGLECGLEEHEHGDSCYTTTETLVCETEEHEHDDSCEAESELTCEIEEHEHDDSCYTETEAEPVKKEISEKEAEETPKKETAEAAEDKEEAEEGHVHTDECYETERVLACGELELHTHDDSCYEEDCFDEDGNLIEGSRPSCGLLQLEEHVHTEECFQIVEMTPEEIAAINGGATLHVHTEECYDEEGNLICGHEVTHLHQLECYDEDGNLICGFGGEEHQHDANCYDEEGNLTCGYENAKDHQHDANCYDEEGNLTCEYQGVKDHQHTKACYDEEGNLTCGYEGVKDHEHDAGCYDEEGNLVCGYEDAKDHEHDAGCYDEEGNLICGYEGARVHEHDANCYDMYGELICGYEGAADHVHTEECYDEEGNLICGYVLREEYTNSRTFEGDNYIVIAKYNDDANIPEEAQLLVEEITPDSDKEHYERRETEYREAVEDEMASMRALLKIGFYVEAEGEDAGLTEIEPETPVTVSVQFLDEDGLPEGSPVTILHFAEEGTEMLDGGSAVSNSTTFKMESFSEIAIGYKEQPRDITTAEDGTRRLHLSDSFTYEDDAFQIIFHVEGEAILPKEEKQETVATEGEDQKETEKEDELSAEASEQTAADEMVADSEESETGDAAEDLKEEAAVDSEDAEMGTEETADTEETDEASAPAVDDETSEAGEEQQGETGEAGSSEPVTPADSKTVAAAEKKENTEIPKLKFTVERADKNSEEYKAFQEHAEKMNREDELLRMCVLTYTLTYGGQELDLSECKVTAEVDLTQKVKEQVDQSFSDVETYLLDHEGEVVQNGGESVPDAAPYLDTENKEGDSETDSDVTEDSQDLPDDSEGNTSDKEDGEAEQDEDASADEKDGQPADDEDHAPVSGNVEDNRQQTDGEGADPEGIGQVSDDVNEYTISVAALSDETGKELVVNDVEAQVYNGAACMAVLDGRNAINAVNVTLSGKANPKFTVQYYANLSVLETAKTGVNGLDIIDTSGKNMPKNGTTPALKYFQVDSGGNIKYKDELTKVYKQRTFEYSQAPSLMYFNVLAENDKSYTLIEIWKLKEGKSADSTNKNDWDITVFSDDLHFTNRQEVADKNKDKKYIVISDNTVLRLVYNTADDTIWKSGVTFYDYDISDGNIYKEASRSKGTKGRSPAASVDNKWYMYTQKQGINSDANYSGKGAKLAFGNGNMRTTLETEKLGKNAINQANTSNFGNGFKYCAFGIVSGLDANGNLIYADGVQAPPLFDEDLKDGVRNKTTGKSTYTDKTLNFIREGDTYTLTAVGGTSTNELEKFKYSSPNWNNTLTLFSNGFWPMDEVPSAGTDKHDAMFGSHREPNYTVYAFNDTNDTSVPTSDHNGGDHNSYFGMKYTVKFKLAKDYIGPLEYYFFGDDDMWVFLDNELICDIGGVHNSVGEYVNLWDYINKEDNMNHEHTNACYDENGKLDCAQEYTLSFFYTERGASGSTCWMQFTLPSVTSMNPEQETGQITNSLKVGKTVENASTTEQYEFEIHFTNPDNSDLPDDYSYSKFKYVRELDENGKPLFDKDGRPVYKQKVEDGKPVFDEAGKPVYEVELVGHDYLIHDGDKFTLGDGEYIVINYLPKGTKYVIKETKKSDKYEVNINGNESGSGSIEADITQDTVVNYVNEYIQYELPETGGPGLEVYTIAGALCILCGAGFLYRKKFRERRV